MLSYFYYIFARIKMFGLDEKVHFFILKTRTFIKDRMYEIMLFDYNNFFAIYYNIFIFILIIKKILFMIAIIIIIIFARKKFK